MGGLYSSYSDLGISKMKGAMSTIATKPLTIEEFDKLDLPEDRNWELRNGELVEVTFPLLIHRYLQGRIFELFRGAFPDALVLPEYSFEIPETNDKRSADVGVTSRERGEQALKKGILVGSPEIVVEVLSPSNSMTQLRRDRRVYFEHGTLLFLVVDPDDSTIEVYVKGEKSALTLGLDDTLEISVFGERKTIPVRAIFAGITVPETR
jgi:Uma2 family endonuclease